MRCFAGALLPWPALPVRALAQASQRDDWRGLEALTQTRQKGDMDEAREAWPFWGYAWLWVDVARERWRGRSAGGAGRSYHSNSKIWNRTKPTVTQVWHGGTSASFACVLFKSVSPGSRAILFRLDALNFTSLFRFVLPVLFITSISLSGSQSALCMGYSSAG